MAAEEHEFLYDCSDKLMRVKDKNSQLELGTNIETSLKMIQYSNDKIIENDLLGNFQHNNKGQKGFQEGLLAVTGQSRLAIEAAQRAKEQPPSNICFVCGMRLEEKLRGSNGQFQV